MRVLYLIFSLLTFISCNNFQNPSLSTIDEDQFNLEVNVDQFFDSELNNLKIMPLKPNDTNVYLQVFEDDTLILLNRDTLIKIDLKAILKIYPAIKLSEILLLDSSTMIILDIPMQELVSWNFHNNEIEKIYPFENQTTQKIQGFRSFAFCPFQRINEKEFLISISKEYHEKNESLSDLYGDPAGIGVMTLEKDKAILHRLIGTYPADFSKSDYRSPWPYWQLLENGNILISHARSSEIVLLNKEFEKIMLRKELKPENTFKSLGSVYSRKDEVLLSEQSDLLLPVKVLDNKRVYRLVGNNGRGKMELLIYENSNYELLEIIDIGNVFPISFARDGRVYLLRSNKANELDFISLKI